jgi:hypothetical protein
MMTVAYFLVTAIHSYIQLISHYSINLIIRTLVIQIASYPDRLGLSGKFVENPKKLTCFEIIGYRIKYSTVL